MSETMQADDIKQISEKVARVFADLGVHEDIRLIKTRGSDQCAFQILTNDNFKDTGALKDDAYSITYAKPSFERLDSGSLPGTSTRLAVYLFRWPGRRDWRPGTPVTGAWTFGLSISADDGEDVIRASLKQAVDSFSKFVAALPVEDGAVLDCAI